MYILPIAAALEMRTYITRTCTPADLISLGAALRVVKRQSRMLTTFILADLPHLSDGQWLPMVRRLMVPLHYMRNDQGYIQTLNLQYYQPYVHGKTQELKIFSFINMDILDDIYKDVETK